jgi:CBS domain containing-hemolysin-like protein
MCYIAERMALDSGLASLLLLAALACLGGFEGALNRLGRIEALEEIKRWRSLCFFAFFLPRRKPWEGVQLATRLTKVLVLLGYAFAATLFAAASPLIAAGALLAPVLLEFLLTLLSLFRPRLAFKACAPAASFFLLLCAPLVYPLLRGYIFILCRVIRETPPFKIRDKILDIVKEGEISPYLDPNEQKLIFSVVSFKERIAREVMVPRIDMFCLPASATIEEAARSFLTEGYSRIPVFRDSIDNIVGVLLYKDVLNAYITASISLSSPIEHILKPILYTPETKKISHLLQEFRNKQIHLAIVVDEYGGTEGIVTFEDILEELVGEIADEYDVLEKELYAVLPSGGWIVDARMSILDIKEELGIKIPQSPEYDTLGGYIFHRAGAIPAEGWRIHHDAFDLEVLSSDERSIGKIKITPHVRLG